MLSSVVDFALPQVPERYVSRSQRARIATEAWALENVYCPRCASDELAAHRPGERVVDFSCPRCELGLQLKAKIGAFGRSFTNSAYQPKIAAIRSRRLPDYLLMSYDLVDWAVTDLSVVPGHFIGEQHVVARKPLSSTAKRAGWIGSSVLLSHLPPDAFVRIIDERAARPPEVVRAHYKRFDFLRRRNANGAGWTADVLREVRALAPLAGMTFALTQLYAASERKLSSEHPANLHVRDKIRQQLQVLRDRGVIEFVAPGKYRLLA